MPMAVVLRVGSADLDLEIDASGAASVRALLCSVAGGAVPDDACLLVDGRRVPPDATVAEAAIGRGSALELARLSAPGPGRCDGEPAVDLWVTGGLYAGQRVELIPGSHVVGCSPDADVRLLAPGVSG